MRLYLKSAIVSAGLVTDGTATEVPSGHVNWRPSPTVGFAGRGNHWYPGATPPTEWWEGTPTKIEVEGVYGKSLEKKPHPFPTPPTTFHPGESSFLSAFW